MTKLMHGAVSLFRIFAVVVLGLLMSFPALKGMWLGYVPVLAGLALAQHLIKTGLPAVVPGWSERRFLAFVIAVPAVVQIVLLLALRPEPSFDGLFVYREAVTLAATGQLSPLTYYPPAQTWWYALWFKLLGATPLVAQLSHLPWHAAVTLLAYGLTRQVASSAARPAAVAVAFYPSFLGYVLTTPYYHYLYTATLVASAWGWWAMARGGRGGLGAGLVSGVGALTKATQLIAPAQAAVFALLAPGVTARRKIALVLLTAAGLGLVLAPWAVRNYRIFGAWVPVCTSGGLVLYSANNPESNGLYSPTPDQAAIHTPADMLAHSQACSEKAVDFIRENPGHFARLAARKVLHTWGSEATFAELINRRGRPLGRMEDLFSAAFLAGWSALVGLWSMAAWRDLRARRPPDLWELLVAVVVGSNLVVYAVFEGGDRHHLPLVPLLVVLALSRWHCREGARLP